MRGVMPALALMLLFAGTAHGEWVKFHKYKSDGAIYYYNKDKLKNNGGIITVWIKADDGYPGKIDVDCKKQSYKSITNVASEIAPDSLMDSLAKIICQEKTEAEK
jgi:hypothetical protein